MIFDLTGIGGILCKILAYGCNFIKKEVGQILQPDFLDPYQVVDILTCTLSSGLLACIISQSHFHN